MNAYEKAQSLGLTGTDAEQFAALQAYGLTANKISIAELLFLLSERNMMVRLVRPTDTGEKWTGSIINLILYVGANGTEDQITAVNKFFSHITNDRNTWFDTTNPIYSASMLAMQFAFADQPNMPTTADFEAVVALGGGRPYVATTLEDFTSQRETSEATIAEQAARAAFDAEWAAALNGGINAALSAMDRTALVAAMRAQADVIGMLGD